MWKIRYVWVVVIMLLMYSTVLAQTLTTDEPLPQKALEIFLKMVFPAIWTGVGPWITRLVTFSLQRVPKELLVVISTILGAVMAGAAGAIPDFPLTIESAAEMGAAGAGTGQVLMNMMPQSNIKTKGEGK